MGTQRRTFLVRGLSAGLAALLSPPLVFAKWSKEEFSITDLDKAITEITGGQEVSEKGVVLKVPKIAENGAQVRVSVETKLPNVEAINLLVEKNPVPLTSRFLFTGQSKPNIAVNLKVRETSDVIAVVKADGKFYRAVEKVRVTAGGCN